MKLPGAPLPQQHHLVRSCGSKCRADRTGRSRRATYALVSTLLAERNPL